MGEFPSMKPTMRNKRHDNLVVYQVGVLGTYTVYVLIINNEIKLCLLLSMVAITCQMWFPNVIFAILFRRRFLNSLLNRTYKTGKNHNTPPDLLEAHDRM